MNMNCNKKQRKDSKTKQKPIMSNNKINLKRLKIVIAKNHNKPISSKICQKEVTNQKEATKKLTSVGEQARQRLQAAQFRFLNEKLYTTSSDQAKLIFEEDPTSFSTYHSGFQHQVSHWPINPLDIIIADLINQPNSLRIADFGCGEARLAKSLPSKKVHSFDLVAVNEMVTACDMAHVPLKSNLVNVAVFCLSLMGINIQDFLKEANRVLTMGGTLFIAEVESRCSDIDSFVKSLEKFGFQLKELDKSNKYFFLAKFSKVSNVSGKASFPKIHLKPCLYKKR